MLGWPSSGKDLRPHRTAMERAAATAVQRAVAIDRHGDDPGTLSLKSYKRRYGEPEDTDAELLDQQAKDSAAWKDIRTWYGAVWALREAEQKVTDLKRAEYVARYHPFQSRTQVEQDQVHWAAFGWVRAMPKVVKSRACSPSVI